MKRVFLLLALVLFIAACARNNELPYEYEGGTDIVEQDIHEEPEAVSEPEAAPEPAPVETIPRIVIPDPPERAPAVLNPPSPYWTIAPDTITPTPVPTIGRVHFSEVGVYIPIGDINSINTFMLPDPTNENLPRWRGFNKVNLFNINIRNRAYGDAGHIFSEADFALANKLGFNFFRLVFDYRYFYSLEDETVDMEIIHWFDVALEYAIKYNIHISLAMHTAPGFHVGWMLDDGLNLATDQEAIDHFIQIWQMLAHRYRYIPNNIMSFNLLNEPLGAMFMAPCGVLPNANYRRKLIDTINVIRAEREDRLIIIDVDGRQSMDLSTLGVHLNNIYQSPHLYAPFSVTHEGMNYQTLFPRGWANRQITWPIFNYFNGFMYGPWKSRQMFGYGDGSTTGYPAVFVNPNGFDEGTVSVRVMGIQYNHDARLRVRADGELRPGYVFIPRDTENMTTFTFPDGIIPQGTQRVEVFAERGDWLIIDTYNISGIYVFATNPDWGYTGKFIDVTVDTWTDYQTIRDLFFPPTWDLENVPTFVGELGCMAVNPTQVEYRARLMRDYIDAIGDLPWAFWEFKGGAMSMFRMSYEPRRGFTTPVTVTFGGGMTMTYWVDRLWYDAIKHSLDFWVCFDELNS